MLTYSQSKDEIRTHLWTEWQDRLAGGYDRLNQSTGLVEHVDPIVFKENGFGAIYTPELKFERIVGEPGDSGKHIAYFQCRTLNRANNTFRGSADGCGTRYTSDGLIMVSLFFSKTAYTDTQENYLSEMTQSIFQRPKLNENQVWFRNPRISEQPANGAFYLNMILVNFRFDEIT